MNYANEQNMREILDGIARKIGQGFGGVPLAAIIPWVDDVNTVPAGFLKCDGSAVSRTMYLDLFGAIGTKYGSGDGSTTFNVPDLTDAAILNGSYDKTTFTTAGSTTFTALKDGWYKITVKGAGGGGAGGSVISTSMYGGAGGGEGGTTFAFEKISKGSAVSITVGAGGVGGAVSTSGSNGGDSSVTVGLNTYIGGGGEGGYSVLTPGSTGGSGKGGNGDIVGAPGGAVIYAYGGGICGGNGGGAGGAISYYSSTPVQPNPGVSGGGGAGGMGSSSSSAGGKGGDGYVWIEYIGTASQYLIKYTPTVIDSEVSAATSASKAKSAAQAAESYAGSAGIPVGTLFPYAADTNTPPTGFLFCNGQAVSRTMYADLFSVLGTTYGPGDGSTTFNLPTEEFLKGVNFGTSNTAPVIYGNAFNRSTGTYVNSLYQGQKVLAGGGGSATHVWITNDSDIPFDSQGTVSSTDALPDNKYPLYADLSSATPQYSSTVHYIIKAYDGVTPASVGIDLSQYASDLGNKASRGLDNLTNEGKDRFLGDDNFTIIYPNGGTEANPANVTTSTRYVESNPFPGYEVACITELYIDGEWGEAPPLGYSGNYTIGIQSFCFDNSIVVQTANYYICSFPREWFISPFPNVLTSYTSAPCRVKIFKIGKVANS